MCESLSDTPQYLQPKDFIMLTYTIHSFITGLTICTSDALQQTFYGRHSIFHVSVLPLMPKSDALDVEPACTGTCACTRGS